MMTTQTQNPHLSFYRDVKDTTGTEITLEEFLDGIATGKWQKNVEKIRALWDNEPAQKALKIQQPNVIIAGTSNAATNNTMRERSGFMAVDFDELGDELETVRLELNADQHTYASFASIRGKGLCVLIRIQPERWEETWEGVKLYYMQKYGRVVDKSTGNEARRRFVSYDKETTVNPKATLFKLYPKKERKAPKQPGTFIHTTNDVEYVLEQIDRRALDLTGDYDQWYKMGFALVSEYGENGRAYFHRLSQYHPRYRYEDCDKTYSYLLRYGARQITIKTFYYYAKLAGLETMTPKTRDIARVATLQKRQKIKPEDVVDCLVKVSGFTREESEPIVKQVFESKEEIETDDTLFDQLELFLRQNYPMRRNEISQYIEDEKGHPQYDDDFNGIWVHAVKVLGKEISYGMVDKLIHSPFTPTYNPFKDFFRNYQHRKPMGLIKALAESIETDTGLGAGEFYPDYAETVIRKWLIGLVSTVYGEHCSLVLVLTGKKGSGKTRFFRDIIPEELQPYFAETSWPDNKDTEMMMCQNLITFNDEWKGKTVKDPETLKSFASRDWFTLRKPYGSSFVRQRRLALMCGTSNPVQIIADADNNRKIIPINVVSRNYAAFNAIDKIDLLMEAYHLYEAGERSDLSRDEIERMGENTSGFESHTFERQLLDQFIGIPTNEGGEYIDTMSALQIQLYLEPLGNNRKLSETIISRELTNMGFKSYQKRLANGRRSRVYDLVKLDK